MFCDHNLVVKKLEIKLEIKNRKMFEKSPKDLEKF